MSSYDHNQPQVAYPPPSTGGGPFVAPPPPVGYPTKEGHGHGFAYSQNAPPVETKSRGDGFWKGCCAALCCCCVLDACF
ncbi:hypothetical protein LWI29_013586 [Acer saccharum]|uniref:Cysteine-rich transmembrane domain-containing protein n=1 Tax=Acer saccharum TaxID=4024 RepID=A0AA39S7Z3_ACESA|nr:hypothetical protein LWI29_017981 [Acer saccharum]KAK0586863.1 hypothetical protein LWI29_013586 [Acer saccharum]KAK1563477.1 hypothetical protein Q3G72_028088 [Acer saccharum]KAK4834712.1 hypothetical protein QYF36_027156 [Acer negundo]